MINVKAFLALIWQQVPSNALLNESLSGHDTRLKDATSQLRVQKRPIDPAFPLSTKPLDGKLFLLTEASDIAG